MGITKGAGTSTTQLLAIVAAVSFILNFAWEMLQAPLFSSMAGLSLVEAVITCARATVGDVAMTLTAYLVVSVATRDVRWACRPTITRLATFCALGIAATIVLEIHAIRTGRWVYADAMPRVPLLEVAWIPILQWIIVPPLCIASARLFQRDGRRS